jgi:hypothetical protein
MLIKLQNPFSFPVYIRVALAKNFDKQKKHNQKLA